MKIFAALLGLLLLAACRGSASDDEGAPDPVALVRTAPAELGHSGDTVTAYGVTEAGPGSMRSLVAPADAIVDRVVAPTGTAVGRGQAVLVLRPSLATRAEAIKANADAAAAQAAYQRAVRLRGDGLVSDADVETARAAAVSARSAQGALGIGGGGLTLRAAVAGTVQGLTARPGDQVAAGTTLATVGGLGDVRARFGVDPALARRIHPGQPVEVQTAGGGSQTVTVAGIDPQVDPTTHLASIYARIPAAANLAVGEPLHASIELGAGEQTITIPYGALLDDGGRSYVFVIRNGVAKAQDVSPGNSAGDRIEILKGLQPGDRVVTEGGTALEDGMKVREQGALPK